MAHGGPLKFLSDEILGGSARAAAPPKDRGIVRNSQLGIAGRVLRVSCWGWLTFDLLSLVLLRLRLPHRDFPKVGSTDLDFF